MKENELKKFLDEKVKQYNKPAFIKNDPVSVPHHYSLLQDIEISGFFAATLAWGNRTTIIKNSFSLMQLMDNAPYQFITQHKDKDLQAFLHFKHRTFNTTDLLYFIHFFKHYYSKNTSLEDAFARHLNKDDENTEQALRGFYLDFFSLPHAPKRTQKHVPTPARKSSCKRLNMFLRWMVRKDNKGVDFGLWKKIKPPQLICPMDLHVQRVSKNLGLMQRNLPDWQAAIELTAHLKKFDANDPVKYDFALFALGAEEKIR